MSVESLIRDKLVAKRTALVEEQKAKTETPELDEAYPGMGRGREEESPLQGGSKRVTPEVLEKGSGGGRTMRKSNAPLAAGSGAFEAKPPKQGDSVEDPEKEDLGKDEPGKIAASKISKTTKYPKGNGPGNAPNYSTKFDPTGVINMLSGKGNRVHGEEEEKNGEVVVETPDYSTDIANLFASETELSEAFKAKATALFEAVVSARVSEKVAELTESLAEEAAAMVAEAEEALVEKIDSYLSEIVEQWLVENEVPVTTNLRAEVAEDFMEGLKNLFKEHYIDVPEEKYDLIGELEANVKEQTEEAEKLSKERDELQETILSMQKDSVIAEVTKGLADTQIEKFRTVIEDVAFEDSDSYTEKLKVIKENIFSDKKKEDIIEEDAPAIIKEQTPAMKAYTDVISRGASF